MGAPPLAEGAGGQEPLGWPGGGRAGEECQASTEPGPRGQFCPQVTLTGCPASCKNQSVVTVSDKDSSGGVNT